MKIEEILTVEVRSNSEIEEILTTGATPRGFIWGHPPRKNAGRIPRRGHQGILNRESLLGNLQWRLLNRESSVGSSHWGILNREFSIGHHHYGVLDSESSIGSPQ